MGAAICGMHYTGMMASVFVPYEHNHFVEGQNFNILAISIAIITSIILGIALAAGAYKKAKAEEELKESDRRKDEFLSTLAHELRNPLARFRWLFPCLKCPALAPSNALNPTPLWSASFSRSHGWWTILSIYLVFRTERSNCAMNHYACRRRGHGG